MQVDNFIIFIAKIIQERGAFVKKISSGPGNRKEIYKKFHLEHGLRDLDPEEIGEELA